MALARSSRRNVELILSFVFGVHFLFVAISHLNVAADRFEQSQPFENGLLAQAKIVEIPDNQRDGTPVSVQFTNNKRKVQMSKTLVHYPEYLRVGQSVEISYQPDNPEWVRAPELGWSESEYAGWRGMSLVWLFGAISIFPLAIWCRFKKPTYKPALELSEGDNVFRVKQHYFRLFLMWSVYSFALFVVYAIVTLSITHIIGLPIWAQKIAILAWHVLLAFKIGLPAARVLFNDPIAINRNGVSFYGRPSVPWADMSQIAFVSGRDKAIDKRLVIALNPSSSIVGYPVWQIPMKKLSPSIYIDLYITRWDDHEIVTAINHFGLEEHDPEAARRLLYSLSESGLITGRTKNESFDAVDVDSISSKDHSYMSRGFHFGSR